MNYIVIDKFCKAKSSDYLIIITIYCKKSLETKVYQL